MKLGKRLPRNDPRDFLLANYVEALPPKPPTMVDLSQAVPNWPMYLNDQIGDCAIASPLHEIECWTYNAHAGVDLTDNDALQGYEAVGGYQPGHPETDNGCVMGDVMDYWRKTGFGGHTIAGYVRVDPKNTTHVKLALWLFGGVQLGLALPLTAESQVSSGLWYCTKPHSAAWQPGSWGGHAVPLVGNTSTRATCVTWAAKQQMTWGFLTKYADEAFAVLSHDWIDRATAKSPTGFDFAALQADLASVS